MSGDDVRITVRVNNQTAAGFRDINGQLRTLDGRFASTSNSVRRSGDGITKSLVDLKATMLSLAPAAVPVAAGLAPIALHAGAAGLAVTAFAAALKPQVTSLSDAAKAQDTYTQAVTKYGANSKQAIQAQQFVTDTLKSMPQATQRAAMAFSNLRGQTKAWSDSMAKFTMVPVERSFAVLGAIIPKLTPMVKETSLQFDRLVTVAGGAVSSGTFDVLSKKVSDFANSSLKSATDKAMHFMRVLSEGNAHGPLVSFMEYARAQGPAVKELFTNLAQAVSNLLQGASQAGPGLLTVVNAFAKLVAAVPPSLVGNLMQVYAAFKLIKLGGAGIAAVGDGFRALATRITAITTASAGATGAVGRLRAGFGALGATAKASLIVGGLALVALGIKSLADKARGAPPDIDKLTSSLKQLASTGRFTGELKKTFGDVDGLVAKMGELGKKSEQMSKTPFGFRIPGLDDLADKIKGAVHDITDGKDSFNALKDDFGALDKTMAGLVSSGYTKEAAKDFDLVAAAAVKQGKSLKDVKALFPEYSSAVADAKYEQELAAQSMGLFGTAAQATQAKLDAQKQSADGLRQSIQALNDVNRQGLGGMIGFEAAVDAAAKAAKDNAGALTMTNGVLNLNSQKARNAASALQDLADKTDSAASSQREAGASWETVNGIYARGRAQLIKNAEAMGLSKDEARALAAQILKIPDKTAKVRMDTEDATRDLDSFNAAVRRAPSSKSVTLKTLSSTAEKILESFGYKVKHLPNGSVKISATAGGALSVIAGVAGAIASLHDKHITLTTEHRTIYTGKGGRGPNAATGGLYTGSSFRHGYSDGGPVVGPGTGTSDDVFAPWLSNGEFVIKKTAVDRYGERMLQSINDGQYKGPGYARGGKVSARTKAEQQARHDAMGDLTISHFGRMAGYRHSEFGSALGKPDSIGSLVGALNQWRGIIMKATHGSTESRLLKQLDSAGKSLLKWEKQLGSVTKSLEKAKDKLASLKDAAAQLRDSVKGNLLSSANITRGASGEGPVTLSSIKSGMRVSKDKVTAFAAALKQLRAKGFSKSIIQQVAEAGIDGGGLETAGALLQASASEVKTINQTQADIEKAAGSAGKTTADAVYEKAIKEQTKVVDKLTKQQHSLQKSMEKLTKAMEKAIERAFGKKAAGGIVGAAASGGLRSSLTWVGEQGPELLDLPAGSRVWSNPDSRRKLAAAQAPWASMLSAPRRQPSYGYAPTGPAPSRDQRVVLEIHAGDSGEYSAFLVRELRRYIRTRGGDSQVVLTGRRYRTQDGKWVS